MRQILLIVTLLLFSFHSFGTVPESIKYQAVVRDNNGNVLPDHVVSLRISILKTSTTGTVVYRETHTITTNSLGLINIEIGNGTPVNGSMASVQWGDDNYFIKLEMDQDGGTNYTLVGTSQLVSVPYSLFSKEAANGTQWKDTTTNIYFSSGSVGVGTNNPQAPLEIRSRGGKNILITGDIPTIRLADTAFTGNGVIIGVAGDSSDLIPGSGKGDLVFTNEAFGTGGGYIFGTGVPSQTCIKVTDDCKVGIGTDAPTSKLQVKGGDINIEDVGSGVIMRSPDGQCWRLTVNNSGQPVFTAINCLSGAGIYDSTNFWGAVAAYYFNGSAKDTTSHGYNGTNNGATLTTGHKGEPNSAYHFTDLQFIDLPDFSTMVNGDEFSIAFWSKTDTQQSHTPFALVPDNPDDRLLGHVNYDVSGNETKIIFDVGNFSTGRHELLGQTYTSAWEHFVFVASQSQDNIRVYRNGVLIINQSGYIAATKTRALRLAAPYYGVLDDVKIFNRALTNTEASAIYNTER